MSWFRLELRAGLDDVTDRAWREVWKVAYAGSASDPTNALFRHAKKSGPSVLYFAPSAHELARTFGAVPCRKPSAEKLVLVAGDGAACELHFLDAPISRPGELVAEGPGSAFISTLTSSAFPTTQPV